jgi:uncharacterized membrane protein (DUF4010 family)
MIELGLLQALGLALGLGMLVGLQRERTADPIAGIRTFGLITLLGALLGWLARDGGLLLPGLGLIVVGGLMIIANLLQMRREDVDPGMTTEFAVLVMYTVGALIGLGQRINPIVISGATAILLHLKPRLHNIARRMGEADFRALMRLVLLALVILPVLPNRAFGPFGVINPFRIGLMVVLIVGISLAGYVIERFFGRRAGTLLAGLVAGLISSTAAAVSFSRQSRSRPAATRTATVLIALSSCVVFARILIELAIVAPAHVRTVGLPVLLLGFVCSGGAVAMYLGRRDELETLQKPTPSSDLWTAVTFGILYGVVLFLAALARERLGLGGLFGITVLSGLTDVDAITLSTAELVRTQALAPGVGGRVVIVAALSNLGFKAAIISVVAGRRQLTDLLRFLLVAAAGGAAILLFLPG